MSHARSSEPAQEPPAGVDPFGRFFTPAEVADRLQVSTTTVLRWTQEGRLPAIRVSERVIRIPVAAFEGFVTGRPPSVDRRVAIRVRRTRSAPRLATAEALPAKPPVRDVTRAHP